MFGGWGISTDGRTLAILVDLGQGETLWLKADENSRPTFEAQGCARFVYEAKGVLRGMNYYSAPPEAMESSALMAPWARLALQAALAKPAKPAKATPAKPLRSRSK
jgi:DNA transformation protein